MDTNNTITLADASRLGLIDWFGENDPDEPASASLPGRPTADGSEDPATDEHREAASSEPTATDPAPPAGADPGCACDWPAWASPCPGCPADAAELETLERRTAAGIRIAAESVSDRSIAEALRTVADELDRGELVIVDGEITPAKHRDRGEPAGSKVEPAEGPTVGAVSRSTLGWGAFVLGVLTGLLMATAIATGTVG